MKVKAVIFGSLLLGLAACSQGGGVGSQPSAQAAQAPALDFSKEYAAVVLPANVNLDFKFTLVMDRTFVKPQTHELRRGVMLEFPEGDVASLVNSLADAFAKDGYAAKRVKSGSGLMLTKKGNPDIYAEVRIGNGQKLRTPDAKGAIWVSWTVGALQ